MIEKRKQIIISEIKHWKQSNLLPAHYCDFLITLYGEGQDEDQEETREVSSIAKTEKKRLNRKIIFLSLLTIIASIGMFVFTQFPEVTIGIAFVLFILFIFLSFRNNVKKSAIIPILYILCALLLFTMSIKIWLVFFSQNSMILIGLLILNCSLWIVVGRFMKQHYFTISGALGLLIIIIFLANSF